MKIQLVDSVQNAIDYIIRNGNYKTTPEVDVKQGSQAGDGYSSKTYSISIKTENEKNINLFVKYMPDVADSEIRKEYVLVFQIEFRFYYDVYPAYKRFQDQKHIKEPFNNVPKHYRTNMEGCDIPPIVLEDLRSLGYTLRDRKKPIDDHHLKSAIQAFARYHAISFAMKDQEPESFIKLSANMQGFFADNFEKFKVLALITKCADQVVDGLDSIVDKSLLDHCKNINETLIHHTKNISQQLDEYAVIIQGDCWSNNMMFLYDDITGLPVDVKLIDWQCQTLQSPALDFCYFFYTSATKEVLNNTDYYLNLYYNALSQRIKELGSDPEKMYPYKIFLEHWRKFAMFGLTMAFFIVKAQLFEEDETAGVMNDIEFMMNTFSAVLKHQDKYVERMKNLIQHFVDHKLL